MIAKTHQMFIFFCLFSNLIFNLIFTTANAQNVLDDIKEEERTETDSAENAPPLVAETIKIISPSRKIFILTNENKAFSKGDFISLLLGNKLVCRALVAKTTEEQLSGIKIMKIYDVTLWKQLAPGKEVLILKGDDSYYSNLAKAPKNGDEALEDNSKLKDEDDLYNSTSLEDDMSLEETSKRLIKPDNVLSVGIGLLPGQNADGASQQYSHINGSWGYQVNDNVWAEFGIGSHIIKDYPTETIDTRTTSFTGRVKFTFNAPFYSYIMPYVGYQVVSVDSPGAGVDDGTGQTSPDDLAVELQKVDDLKKNSIIFGATILKRLVPGWFVRLDLGTDIISGGLALEF